MRGRARGFACMLWAFTLMPMVVEIRGSSPRLQEHSSIVIEVDPAGVERFDCPVEVELALAEPGRVRLTEEGRAVPFQYDRGSICFVLQGHTEAGRRRQFRLERGDGVAAGSGVRVEGGVPWQGQDSLRIHTARAVYYYHKEGAGFARIDDGDGADWIGYRPGGRSAGEFRGIPNMGEFAHPGYTAERGSRTQVVASGPLRAVIRSERHDGAYLAEWTFFAEFARLRVLKIGAPFWFLYEGTPGGSFEPEEDYHVLSNGQRYRATEIWDRDIEGPEWLYFGDRRRARVLFLANHQDDAHPDQYWPMEGNMTVFGFGRRYKSMQRFFDSTPAVFTIGFVESADHETVATRIRSAVSPLRVSVRQGEK